MWSQTHSTRLPYTTWHCILGDTWNAFHVPMRSQETELGPFFSAPFTLFPWLFCQWAANVSQPCLCVRKEKSLFLEAGLDRRKPGRFCPLTPPLPESTTCADQLLIFPWYGVSSRFLSHSTSLSLHLHLSASLRLYVSTSLSLHLSTSPSPLPAFQRYPFLPAFPNCILLRTETQQLKKVT